MGPTGRRQHRNGDPEKLAAELSGGSRGASHNPTRVRGIPAQEGMGEKGTGLPQGGELAEGKLVKVRPEEFHRRGRCHGQRGWVPAETWRSSSKWAVEEACARHDLEWKLFEPQHYILLERDKEGVQIVCTGNEHRQK